ncbi:hypothetical protein [Nocardia arizonensis]|uniref:hypothetical protein n=1 Tax=Nocardia arizonensis TaxID=1141647 RepID=UPI0006CFAC66|nr:hypothetical protein [Nocardia arizonensis]
MTATVITAADLVHRVRELANASPQATTPTAGEHPHGDRYVIRDDTGGWRGSRLLGRALLDLGAHPDQLAEHDAYALSAASTVLHFVGLGVWAQDLLWLNVVQVQEGRGRCWCDAVAFADLRIPGIGGGR